MIKSMIAEQSCSEDGEGHAAPDTRRWDITMKSKLSLILICLFYLILVAACSKTQISNVNSNDGQVCTEEFAFGINVKVFDEAENLVTDAAVKITDGDYSEILELQGNIYSGAGERPGNYTLYVAKTGYSPYLEDIEVQENTCHVIPESVSVYLEIE